MISGILDNQNDRQAYQLLRELRLSNVAISCYESLCEEGPTTVGKLAERLKKQPACLYRELKQLEQKGFVVSLKTTQTPTYFYHVPAEEALERLADYQYQMLRPLIDKQASSKNASKWRRPRHRY